MSDVIGRRVTASGLKTVLIGVLFSIVGCFSGAARFAADFTPPPVKTFFLKNGIKVFYAEDFELPTFSATVYFPRGGSSKTASTLGLYAGLSGLLRSGGIAGISADEFDQQLESLSASISADVNDEFSTISFGGLRDDAGTVTGLAAQLLEQPAFDESRIALWKSQIADAINKRGESVESIAATSFMQLLYRGSLLGTPLRSFDIDTVSADGLRGLHREIFSEDGAMVAISGALSEDEARSLLENTFGTIVHTQRRSASSAANVPPNFDPLPGIYWVEKPFPQASVYIGELGPRRFVPDYPAIEVFNGIFGSEGEFSSMLTQAIRTERGLAYSVVGGIYRDEPVGRNFIGFQTKGESAGEGIRVALETLASIKNGKMANEQLEDVKNAARNSFVFRYDSISEIVRRKALIEILHYPSSYDGTFLTKIEGVSLSDVSEVARKYLDEPKLSILVVGDRKAFASLKKEPLLKNRTIKKLSFDQELRLP